MNLDLGKAVGGRWERCLRCTGEEAEFSPGKADGSRREIKHRQGVTVTGSSQGSKELPKSHPMGEGGTESDVSSALNSRPPVFRGKYERGEQWLGQHLGVKEQMDTLRTQAQD